MSMLVINFDYFMQTQEPLLNILKMQKLYVPRLWQRQQQRLLFTRKEAAPASNGRRLIGDFHC